MDLYELIQRARKKDADSWYLARCIKNQYILLLKREIEKKREIYFTEMSEAQEFRVKTQMAVEDCYEGLIFIEIKAILNKKEWFIIEQIFIKGRTAAEIGNLMGVTRQAVNQIKIRSLRKIKRVLSPEK